MKKIYFLIALLMTLLTSQASATIFYLEPSPKDLQDLDHSYYYAWEVEFALPENHVILDVSLEIDNITNWDNRKNDLYITLFDNDIVDFSTLRRPRKIGEDVWRFQDRGRQGNNWDIDTGLLIDHWVDTNGKYVRDDLSYSFRDIDSNLIDALSSYTSNDNQFNIGFDPDCHYWNDGVSLKITTEEEFGSHNDPVPEPATIIMFLTSILGVAGIKKWFI